MRYLAIGLMLAASTSAYSGQYYVENDTLMCASKQAYDEQMKYLAQGVVEFAPNCGATNKDYTVVVLDRNAMSPSKVRVIENNLIIWVNNTGLKSR